MMMMNVHIRHHHHRRHHQLGLQYEQHAVIDFS